MTAKSRDTLRDVDGSRNCTDQTIEILVLYELEVYVQTVQTVLCTPAQLLEVCVHSSQAAPRPELVAVISCMSDKWCTTQLSRPQRPMTRADTRDTSR